MPEVPEVYADLFWITLSPYTVIFDFGKRLAPRREHTERDEGQQPDPQQRQMSSIVARIRMSPEHAKVLAIILRRHLQEYERQTGVMIDVPAPILQELGIAPEDWRQFGAGG